MTFHRIRCFTAAFLGLFCAIGSTQAQSQNTTTPIKYLVVIFDENQSFDHYFGTYPNAANPQDEPVFHAAAGTPEVNGLSGVIQKHNPNTIAPFRLDRSQNVTCDNDNAYTDEQKGFDGGLMDKFATVTSSPVSAACPIVGLSMGYYDGNTVTALWNYAQHFAMSDNFFDTEFGTTVMGHLNLISGSTHTTSVASISGKVANGSVIANVEAPAANDDCTSGTPVLMTGKNVGDLLNAAGVTWGWFYGDWLPTSSKNGAAVCTSLYNNHYDPFNYYTSTANPHHLPPSVVSMIGQTDQANHQYSVGDFWNAAYNGVIPAVSFLKASTTATGHPAKSDPLSEQTWLVSTINDLMKLPQWNEMAILITYDDSDGWYDHVAPPIVSQSNDSANDAANGSGLCGTPTQGAYLDRCGYGQRLPFLVISPFAKPNFVDHTTTDTTSILRFIEDNWNLGRIGDQSFDAIAGSILNSFDFTGTPAKPLILDPTSGEPATTAKPTHGSK
ncbi:MAG TPA: alkaline phosphatase family protein [Bryobacteraceae bacterium]|jgi:phospholipase C